jgi:hypothetical protein
MLSYNVEMLHNAAKISVWPDRWYKGYGGGAAPVRLQLVVRKVKVGARRRVFSGRNFREISKFLKREVVSTIR